MTVVVPFLRGGNEQWLAQAKGGFPAGQKLIVVENDGEMAEALNDAIINHVETPWVYRFDADDIAGPLLLQQLRDAVWDGADGAYPTMILVPEERAPEGFVPIGVHHADQFCSHRLETYNYITGASLFRREMFVKVGGYRDLPALEDWDLWLRMVRECGARLKAVPEAFFYYRQVYGSRNKHTGDPLEMKRLYNEITGERPRPDDLATFYFQGTPMVAHLRCVNPAKWLPGIAQPAYQVPYTEHEEQPRMRFLHHRGAAVMQFASTQADSLIGRWLQLNGHPLFVEMDDNYTVTGGRIARWANWQAKVIEKGKALEAQKPSVEGHIRIVRSADGVICTTEYLAEQYRPLNPNVWVCPNQVEPSEWPAEPLSPDDGIVRIGWFASGSHDRDYPLIAKALRWAGSRKNVEIVSMGVEISERKILRYRPIPWCDDWGVYRLALGALDIGLAPILATPWSLGRSDLKALDYAMGAALPILQDDRPYEEWVHGVNCLKAKTPEDWLRAVKYAVYNAERRREIAAEARRYTLEERTFEKNSYRWAEAISSARREAVAA